MGRRIAKILTQDLTETDSYFIYDGWNIVAILGLDHQLLYSFNWGADASGTIQGAGGVGGLVSMTVHSGGNAGTYFYAYDGNFNVMALVSAANGAVVAQYEYSPFGAALRAVGPMSQVNPFAFSTKYTDVESGCIWYGRRYLAPILGRWMARDPAAEKAACNLYEFARNCPMSFFDVLGADTRTFSTPDGYSYTVSVDIFADPLFSLCDSVIPAVLAVPISMTTDAFEAGKVESQDVLVTADGQPLPVTHEGQTFTSLFLKYPPYCPKSRQYGTIVVKGQYHDDYHHTTWVTAFTVSINYTYKCSCSCNGQFEEPFTAAFIWTGYEKPEGD